MARIREIGEDELEAFRRYLDQESLAGTEEAFGGDWAATEI